MRTNDPDTGGLSPGDVTIRGGVAPQYHNLDRHIEDQAEPENKSEGRSIWLRFCPLLFAALIMTGVIVGALVLAKSGPFNDTPKEDVSDVPSTTPLSCREKHGPPGKRTILFWQSEKGGCEDILDGVTHVIWGFAEVERDTSRIKAEFQGNQDTLKYCVKQLRKRCIFSLGSVGGASNTKDMATINDPTTFADTALALIHEFELDGVDIDDETVGEEFNKDRIINYMKELHTKVKSKDPNLLITFDGLVYSADDDRCVDPKFTAYSRCFPTEISQYVDWIHILAYNVAEDKDEAKEIYEGMVENVFPVWESKIGAPEKVVYGICIDASGGGCAYGPGPSEKVISSWIKDSASRGGMMLYSGSADISNDFAITNKLVKEKQ